VLKRVRGTAHQVGLTRVQRAENVTGAFRIAEDRKGWVRDRRLILVDDVLTTGATIEACARVLRRAGAARVDVLTAARVVDGPFAVHI
jgi:predicted amidophosphoribosyltransferase